MDEKLINELIEQLEQNLKNVESARQQVEKTVGAYDVLKTEVNKYTIELSFITQNVRTMISQLEEMKERFLGNISTKIVDEINLAVTTITTAIDGISSQITSLYDLTDTKAKQIDGTVNTLKGDEKAHYESIVKQMEEQENRLNTEFDVVRKHNMIFSIIIIVLLVIIISLLAFGKSIW